MQKIHIIGAGLAGCEAANVLANGGVQVILHEMKPAKRSPAHQSDGFAELVCSNSLKAKRIGSAAGMLKREMASLSSLIIDGARVSEVSAGGALAVDRDKFSDYITDKIKSHPNIEISYGEVTSLTPGEIYIIATGPLSSEGISKEIKGLVGEEELSFYDAAAPIITHESIDLSKVFLAARYDRGEADYINCPFEKDEYLAFVKALVEAEKAPLKEFEKEGFKVYEGCMPIETLAARGEKSLSFGPLKPVGLTNPNTGRRPYAVVQLRAENKEGSLYNLVGFQTNLKFGEQKRVFSMIPGLENAEFVRYGLMHRNTFINSPRQLNPDFSLKSNKNIYFAGQITGVEGYLESAASGINTGLQVLRRLLGKDTLVWPRESMMGAVMAHATGGNKDNFQPMGANIGILPASEERIRSKEERYIYLSERGYKIFTDFLEGEEIDVIKFGEDYL